MLYRQGESPVHRASQMTLKLGKLLTGLIAAALGFSFVTANAAPTETELLTSPKPLADRTHLR